MAQAGVTALFSQFITGMVDTGGNLGETFKRMGSEEGLTQTVTTVLTAGALEYLGNIPFGENGVKLGSIDGKSPFTDQLGKNLIYGVTGAAMRSAMTGESFEDQLPSVFMLALLQSGAAKGAYAIGGSGLSDGMKLALHTALGCGVGAIKQDSSEGCAPGAMGALVAEVWANENGEKIKAESATPEDAKKEILDQSTFAGTIAGCVVGGPEGCSTGGMTGRNAVENNYLNHVDASRLAELQKKANDGTLTPQEAQERQDLILKDQKTTAELDACRTKNTVQCQKVKADFAQAQQSFLPDQQDIQKWAEAKSKTGPYSAAQLVDAYNANFTKGPLPPSQTTAGDLNPAADWIRNELSNDAKTNGANVLDKVYMGWATANAPAVGGAFSAGVIPKQTTTKVGASGGTTSSGSKPGAKTTGADGANGGFSNASSVSQLTTAERAMGGQVIDVNPAELRWTQTTAGGNGRADAMRKSMAENGYNGPPIDVVQTPSGIVTVDHTRAAVALEQGISPIPATLHLPTDLLPTSMAGRFGSATTWGEAAAYRAANQRPPLPADGTTTPPKLPAPQK